MEMTVIEKQPTCRELNRKIRTDHTDSSAAQCRLDGVQLSCICRFESSGIAPPSPLLLHYPPCMLMFNYTGVSDVS